MKIKEVASNEIHWSIKRWNEGKQANDELRKRLGDTAQHFATCNIGHGYYQWNSNIIGQWLPLNNADTTQREKVTQRVEEIRKEVNAKMLNEPDLAEQLLEVPTIDYYYFRTLPDGTIDVLITGWGYRNFRKDPPFRITTPQKKASLPTTLSFVLDGMKLPNRAFTLKAAWTTNPDQKTTDQNGDFTFQEPIGTTLEVVDVLTGKNFNIRVSEAHSTVILDITDKTSLTVRAMQDGQPIIRETVSIDYNGHQYNLPLNNDGTAVLNDLSLVPGQSCTASLRDQQQTIELAKGAENVVTFQFQSTPPSLDRCSLTVEAYSDGQPINNELASVDYANQHYDLTLNNGRATIDELLMVGLGSACRVSVRGAQQTITPVKGMPNVVRFDFASTPPAPTMARITVIDAKGQPMRGMKYSLQQGTVDASGTLDAQGSSVFVKNPFVIGAPLTAHLITPEGKELQPIEFTLEPQENEYLLQELAGKKRSPWLEILMFLLLLLILALLLVFIFKPGANTLTNLINQSIF